MTHVFSGIRALAKIDVDLRVEEIFWDKVDGEDLVKKIIIPDSEGYLCDNPHKLRLVFTYLSIAPIIIREKRGKGIKARFDKMRSFDNESGSLINIFRMPFMEMRPQDRHHREGNLPKEAYWIPSEPSRHIKIFHGSAEGRLRVYDVGFVSRYWRTYLVVQLTAESDVGILETVSGQKLAFQRLLGVNISEASLFHEVVSELVERGSLTLAEFSQAPEDKLPVFSEPPEGEGVVLWSYDISGFSAIKTSKGVARGFWENFNCQPGRLIRLAPGQRVRYKRLVKPDIVGTEFDFDAMGIDLIE